jgi:hypothetical protein
MAASLDRDALALALMRRLPRLLRSLERSRETDGARAPAPLAAAVVVACALAVAAVEYTDAFRAVNNRAAHNAGQSERDRSLEIARTLGIAPQFVAAALRLPDDATYAVATGPRAPAGSPLIPSALAGYLENLLLPRIRSRDDAEWLLCYGCELPPDGLGITWRDDGMVVARFQR